MERLKFTQRNEVIDILRASTMLLMIFVNDFWTVDGVPKWMQHANTNEDFLGLADVVFPLFLFVMGMSIPYAIESRSEKGYSESSTILHILTRTFALLIMGVFTVNTEYGFTNSFGISRDIFRVLMVLSFLMIWNIYPKTKKPIRYLYVTFQIIGVISLIFLAFIFRDSNGGIMQARWWGILGLIGWTYFVCSFIYLLVRDNAFKILLFFLGFIVLCLIKSSNLIPRESFVNSLLNIFNLGTGANVSFTMGGTLFSVLIVKYSHFNFNKKLLFVLSTVTIFLLAAIISNNFWIISKNRGTLPWVLYCIAIAIGSYSLISYIVSKGKASWFRIIKTAGTATLTCYLMPYILYSVIYGFMNISLPEWMKEGIPGLIKCAFFAFLCIGITALMERYKIKIKV
ncbi:MAG: DUF5009 domain-containing protein [Fermentimonas sp.]|nr:DUF5009 domain-containing protein [Fermentimonas sp.]